MLYLYHLIFYQPIFNILIGLYLFLPFHDLGLSIIILTIFLRFLLLPITLYSLRSQKALQELQPKLKALQEKYKDNKELLAQELVKLYSQNKVNPASSCLPLLIQLPIFIALYQALISGLANRGFDALYSFMPHPQAINTVAFGFLPLDKPNIIVAILAGLSQFWQSRFFVSKKQMKVPGSKDESMLSMFNQQMTYFMPFFTFLIGASLPSGLTFYWFLSNLLTVFQQYFWLSEKKSASS